jgi:F0F1-type ATP synthase membrane subunit b/b'
MTIDPHVSIVFSFVGFVGIFAVKIYPLIVQSLDEHIQSIKNKIKEVESLKDDSYVALKKALADKDDISEVIEKNKRESVAKIERMKLENEKYLKILRRRFETSLETRLEAEAAKQKDLLIGKLADQIVKRASERISSSGCEISVDFAKEDLKKLIRRSEI